MCRCTPEMRTPFCGKPGCEWPTQLTSGRPNLRIVASKPDALNCTGIGRDAEHDKCAVVYFNRRLTDDELRFFHEVCKRSAPLMDGAS